MYAYALIPTEPIGSIPRFNDRKISHEEAVTDTILQFNKTGSPILTDGEQNKSSFLTYPLAGDISPNGITISFQDGHTRQLPLLTKGPFAYAKYAVQDLRLAKKLAPHAVFKQAVISASALSLIYPPSGIVGYSREEFLNDLVKESVKDIRLCLDEGAHCVQMDFTEARLSLKLDPSKALLKSFIDLNNRVLSFFTLEERQRIGVHTCPGGDQDSTHSHDVPYSDLLPHLFQLNVQNFYIQLASEPNRKQVLSLLKEYATGKRRIFIGVTNPISSVIETPEQVRDQILEALEYIGVDHLGTTDDCGFSPFGDDVSTTREVAFAKIHARVRGTNLAIEVHKN